MKSFNITGIRFKLLELRSLGQMLSVAWAAYPDKTDAVKALWRHLGTHQQYSQAIAMRKAVRTGAGTFVQQSLPRLGSPAMKTLVRNELSRQIPIPNWPTGLNTLIFAITKKCPLQCAHCLEWDNLNQREQLSSEEITQIVRHFQSKGVSTIELSGGEPLNRFGDLLQALQQCDTQQSDFWLNTSGYRLTREKAQALKNAGLVGVCVSLDHWERVRHDAFRGMEGSYDWALKAAQHALEAGLALGFSLTAQRECCERESLMRYAELAREQGAHFIRLLEPRAVGHFAGQDVELRTHETKAIEDFAQELQTSPAFRQYPIIEYYAAYQRRAGCSGAGGRFLYVDTDGDMHACPFCQNKCGNALREGLDGGRHRMAQASGCHIYHNA